MNILLNKAKKRDTHAFASIMKENEKSMYKVAKAILKSDEDVADAMQETALICWEKIHTLKKNEYFKTWLIRILINQCNAIYRRRMKIIPYESLQENVIAKDEFNNVEWENLLTYLDEKYRIVIVLYYVEEFKVKEIARMLEISESAVKGRLVTARKKMEMLYVDGKEGKVI